MEDSRYPYTYSCDLIRHFGPVGSNGVVLSRSDASKIREGLATALGFSDLELASKLSDYYLQNQDRLAQEGADKILKAIRL